MRRLAIGSALAAALLVGPGLHAQGTTPCVRGYSSSFWSWPGLRVQGAAGQAYTATVKHTHDMSFADGNAIHWSMESTQAQDAEGRTARQHVLTCELDINGVQHVQLETTVDDPKQHTLTTWTTGWHAQPLVRVNYVLAQAAPPPPAVALAADGTRLPEARAEETIRKDLGTRTLLGYQATGWRSTRTIPAGVEGNDLPLRIVKESWSATQKSASGVTFISFSTMDDDPRVGRNTMEVTGLTLGPPDPALFTPPASYKVWENKPSTPGRP